MSSMINPGQVNSMMSNPGMKIKLTGSRDQVLSMINLGLQSKLEVWWVQVWRSSEQYDVDPRSEDQLNSVMNLTLTIKWAVRWTQIWRSSEKHDEFGSEDQVNSEMHSDL